MIGAYQRFPPSKAFDVVEMLETIEKTRANVMVAVGDGQCVLWPTTGPGGAEGRRYDVSSLAVILTSGMALSVMSSSASSTLPKLLILDVLASTEGHYISITPIPPLTGARQDRVQGERDGEGAGRGGTRGARWRGRRGRGGAGTPGLDRVLPRRREKRPHYRKVGGQTYIFTGDMGMWTSKATSISSGGAPAASTPVRKGVPGGGRGDPEPASRRRALRRDLGTPPALGGSGHRRHPAEGRRGSGRGRAEVILQGKTRGLQGPKYVIFVDELPRLITGKVHYRELKQLVGEKYEGGSPV